MKATLIGIDCATAPNKVGLALGSHAEGKTCVEAVCLGSVDRLPAQILSEWIQAREAPVLIALDAPLGWPVPLAESLHRHRAGEGLQAPANALFRRHTDRIVREVLGKQSLDVGADRIARTAHAALALLGSLRDRLDDPIPMAWNCHLQTISAIEVYPAATLTAHAIDTTGYKAKQGLEVRQKILSTLRSKLRIETEIPDLDKSSNGLDATICLLAAHDFLLGDTLAPQASAPVTQEGWIWFKLPEKRLSTT